MYYYGGAGSFLFYYGGALLLGLGLGICKPVPIKSAVQKGGGRCVKRVVEGWKNVLPQL